MRTTSQTDSIWPNYMEKKKIGQMGPINGWGPLCEVSLSLFTAELERRPLKLLLLLSSIFTGSFEIRELQVRVLAKSIFFSGLVFGFAHPKTIYEPTRASMSQVVLFEAKGVTRSLFLPE